MNIMFYYHERYPDNLSAIQMYIAESSGDLPEGVYAFLELYCCNLDCDCKEVFIEITKQSAMNLGYFEMIEKPLATLVYTWEKPLSDHNPYFYNSDQLSEWSHAARQVFIDYVEVVPEYNKELAARYLKMKSDLGWRDNLNSNEPKSYVRTSSKLGRNEPCACGSGKKYKKCCLGH